MAYPYFTDADTFLQACRKLPPVKDLSAETIELYRQAEGTRETLYLQACQVIPQVLYDMALGNRPDYADLVMIGAGACMSAVDSWQPDRDATLRTWAYKLCLQAVAKEMRRAWRHENAIESVDVEAFYGDDVVAPFDDSDDGAADTAAQQRIDYERILASLPEEQARVLDYLRQGYTYAETAAKTGVSPATISRLIADLRNKFAES